MSDDPLAAFRSRSILPRAQPEPASPDGREPYRAFAGKDGQRKHRLDIRCKDGMAHAVGYNFIIEIAYDRKEYSGIVLVMSTMLVKVFGKRLRPIVDTLKLGVCEFIQEWDQMEFDELDDVVAPLVEKIEVVTAAQR